MSGIRFPCGNCSYLSCNEAQQQEAKNEGIDMNHYCKKYNKRLFHYTDSIYHSPEIYACEECNNQTYNTYNKLDKYIREEFRRSMEDDSAFKINYPSAEKFLEIVKMMKKESNLIGKRSMTFYESDFYRERLEAVSNRIKLDIEEAIKNNKSLKPIPNKAAKTKDSIYKTLIYDGRN